jgi:Fe-S-cluster containining protein
MGPPPSPCDGCDARCCGAYSVHVTGDDVWRIAGRLGVAAADFLAYAPQAVRSATGFLLEPGGPSHDLMLAPAKAAGERAPCVFLRGGPGGSPRCGVYPFRPVACRRFPAARLDGGYGVRDGIVCGPGAWAGHAMGALSWRVALGREARELETYAAAVAAWNAGIERAGAGEGRDVAHYLDWLTEAYGWLVRWRATLGPRRRHGAEYLAQIRETLAACRPR